MEAGWDRRGEGGIKTAKTGWRKNTVRGGNKGLRKKKEDIEETNKLTERRRREGGMGGRIEEGGTDRGSAQFTLVFSKSFCLCSMNGKSGWTAVQHGRKVEEKEELIVTPSCLPACLPVCLPACHLGEP